jgi:hypothetical protein
MHLVRFGGTDLFRPSRETQTKFRVPADAYLRSRFSSGDYVGGAQVNEILHHMYGFYAGEFARLIKDLSSHQLLEFVLHQYDETIAIEDQLKAGTLDAEVQRQWEQLGPTARKALKFIAEEIVLMPADAPALPEEQLLEATEILWICAEEMVNLAIQSDYVFTLFPDDATLTIHPPDAYYYWTLNLAKHVEDTLARVAVDRAQPRCVSLVMLNARRFLSFLRRRNGPPKCPSNRSRRWWRKLPPNRPRCRPFRASSPHACW